MQRFDKEIPDALRADLESRANVVGVGRGPKRTDGGRTDEEAVVVLVREKVPEDELDEADLVPRTVSIEAEGEEEEVQTDVVETGDLYAFAGTPPAGRATAGEERGAAGGSRTAGQQGRTATRAGGAEGATVRAEEAAERPSPAPGAVVAPAMDRRSRWRPAAGGVSIGHRDVTAGTLGSSPLLTQDDEVVFLTNAHVAAPEGVQRGDPIVQPGRSDGGVVPDDRIGSVLEWATLSPDRTNESDSALVAVDDDRVENDLLGLDDLRGWANARFDEPHYKSGRTTGVTSGTLVARDVTANVNYRGRFDEPLAFGGLDVFDAMSTGGDSGSLIGRRKADGFYASDLLFAGSDRVTLGIPMNVVQQVHGTLEPITDGGGGTGGPSEAPTRGPDGSARSGGGASAPAAGQRPGGVGAGETTGDGAPPGGERVGGTGATGGGEMPGGGAIGGEMVGGGRAGGDEMAGGGTAGGAGATGGAGRAATATRPVEAEAVGGLREHFSGTLEPNQTQHWVTWGWSPEYQPAYWVVPTNPNGRVETSMQVERQADDALTYHLFVTNRSSVHTGFRAKYAVFS